MHSSPMHLHALLIPVRPKFRPALRWWSALCALLLALSCLSPAVRAGDDIPFVWQGTITSAQTRLATPPVTGSVTDHWVLRARWKETQRIEVKDAEERLIGWFVKLEDDGSRWEGETAGKFVVGCLEGGNETRVEIGEGSGSGIVFTPGWGWIYYSASEDDPLASVLPNGSYSITSTTTSTQKYTVQWTRYGCRGDVTQNTRPAYLHYRVGGRFMFEPFAAPGGATPPFLPVQAVQAMASQRMNVPAAWPFDRQSRQIADGRMQGSASNRFYNAYSNTLSWNIARVLDLKPVIKKCDETWRPQDESADQQGSEISVSASVPGQPDIKGKWRFTLMNISCEPGYCLNAGEDAGLDLEFVRDQEGFAEPRTIRGGSPSSASSGGTGSSGEGGESASGGGASGGAVTMQQWESGKPHETGDMVLNEGTAYTCIKDHTAGAENEPGVGAKWETYWRVGMTGGATAATTTQGSDSEASAGSTSGAAGGCGEQGGEEEIEGNQTVNEVTVRIKSKDYGAWAKLKAEINVDGVWYQAQSEDGKDYITIPHDQDENRIADHWETRRGVSGQAADADQDEKPEGVGREPGDGFTNYEEYRGVMVHGEWTDLDPGHKDLFIRDETGLGTGLLHVLGLSLHLIDEGEHQKMVINYNRGYATLQDQQGQKGLLLRQEALDNGVAGEVRPMVGCPNAVDEVVINAFPSGMEDAYREDYEALGGTFDRPNLEADIAHELAHGLNVLHHGKQIDELRTDMQVACPQGVWSGDMYCIMRYDPPLFYYEPATGKVRPYPVAEEQRGAVRTLFCDSPAGTGVNAPGHQPRPISGDAASGRGACRQQVTIKGYHTRETD